MVDRVTVQIHPPRSEFASACASAPMQPVWSEVLCDADTPVGVYARLRSRYAAPFLLESVVGREQWARYSFIGLGHRLHLRGTVDDDGQLTFDIEPGPGFALPEWLPRRIDGLDGLRELMGRFRGDALAAAEHAGLLRFWGGFVGVWGHDFVRSVERLPHPPSGGPSMLPAVELVATDTLIIFDNLSQRVRVVATACPDADGGIEPAWDRAAARVTEVCRCLAQCDGSGAEPLSLSTAAVWEPEPAEPWTRDGFLAGVRKARDYIAAGDIFQVVLMQGFETPAAGAEPLDVYRLLRVNNPSPYMYMMELPIATLVGASPEVLVRFDRDTREVMLRPIAGTIPRGRDPAEDQANEAKLLADPKERAEHLMLIDLGRNDVGRVSQGGSVRMTAEFNVERYSRVMHIVSEVVGALRDELDALDVLASCFPAGTLSGAPKVRALEIIHELEMGHRGWYSGAVGYLGYDGGADFAICIRSAVQLGDRYLVQAGAGIVYDSDPEREDAECRAKAHAVLDAIAQARIARSEGGLGSCND